MLFQCTSRLNNLHAMTTIQWGIIGCGNVTELKSGPAFNKIPHSKLVAVMRRDQQLLKEYAVRHAVPMIFSDASALIHHPEINAVYIATPPHMHEHFAIEVLRANKFCYVEKPMATTVQACLNMQSVTEEMGGKLVIAHYRRALPMFLKVKELIEKKYIGDIKEVVIIMHKKASSKKEYLTNWRVDKAIAGGGFFYDLAPHQLDLVFYFFGEAISYQGKAKNTQGLYAVEDTVTGTMQLKKNIQFTGDWCFAKQDEMEKDAFIIKGELGVIQFEVFGQNIEISKAGNKECIHFEPPTHIQQPMIEKVVNYFLEKGENPCSAADAILSMQVMEAFVYGKKAY